MKNKFGEVVFKKFQSYSFIIFIALIVGAFFALSQLNRGAEQEQTPTPDTPTTGDNQDQDDNTDGVVKIEDETFKLPVAETNPEIARNFYDLSAPVTEQIKALIKYENNFFTNNGVNYTIDKETKFDVLASISGEVKDIKEDAMYGNIIVIEHPYGFTTEYHSLSTVEVAIGDQVTQGDVIGQSGANNIDSESGIHVHFEIKKDGNHMNPSEMIGKKLKEFKNN